MSSALICGRVNDENCLSATGTAMKFVSALTTCVMLSIMLSAPLYAQDSNAAAERARLANQRIQAEAERRAQEERERLAAIERAAASAKARGTQQTDVALSQSSSPSKAPISNAPSAEPQTQQVRQPWEAAENRARQQAEMSIALEQIRSLGELRDRGYVTEEEFAAIKKRILASQQ